MPGAVVELQGFGETLADVLIGASFFAMLLSISLGAVALVLRMRRSTGQQRLQLRWIATGAAVLAVTFVVFAVSQLVDPRATPWILPEATCLAYIFFSVTVGVAIFRYRLYDIDVILNRAIVLGVLAVFVTVGYIVVVVAIGAVLQAVGAPGSTLYWPSLVATALVAVAFQPVRRHVLRLADRLVYGNQGRAVRGPGHAEPAARRQPVTGRVAGQGRRGHRAGGRCRRHGGAARQARGTSTAAQRGLVRHRLGVRTGPDRGVPTLVLPVLDMAEQVGSIEVTMPPGRALRTFERDLLQDVAAQAGVAFRNALLEAELAARVEQGEAQSAELAASRRRLLGVEDEARERLAGAIRRNVVPHLAAVDAELTAGPAADQSAARSTGTTHRRNRTRPAGTADRLPGCVPRAAGSARADTGPVRAIGSHASAHPARRRRVRRSAARPGGGGRRLPVLRPGRTDGSELPGHSCGSTTTSWSRRHRRQRLGARNPVDPTARQARRLAALPGSSGRPGRRGERATQRLRHDGHRRHPAAPGTGRRTGRGRERPFQLAQPAAPLIAYRQRPSAPLATRRTWAVPRQRPPR